MPQAWALLGDTGTPTGGLDKWDSDMDPASDGREICGSRVRGWKDGKRIDPNPSELSFGDPTQAHFGPENLKLRESEAAHGYI